MAIVLDPANGVTFNDLSLQGAAASPYVLKNRIINGDMRIDQRNAGASVTPANGAYTLDRWGVYQFSSASKFSVQQDAGAVTPPTGFTDYLGVTSLSAYSVAVGDIYGIYQRIEGFNVADLGWGTSNAQTVTLSFWVRSSLTGTFGGAFQNDAGDRAYPFTYTISSANTWEQKTITVAGDTTGTWLKTNGDGLQITFGLGVGSNRSATAGSWQAGNFGSATGATSVVGTNGATWYVTGVQLEVGSTATPFERRLYGQELANCQRYYYNHVTGSGLSICSGFYYTATAIMGTMNFPTTMRVSPTVSATSGTDYYKILRNGTSDTFNGIDLQVTNTNCYTMYQSSNLSGTVGQGGSIETNNASAFISFNAEL
jgi:hypothetical protein